MVGRVVGKRRKRPLPDAKLSESLSAQWSISAGPTTLPSPTPTYASEPQSKRSCYSNAWSEMVQNDDQQSLNFSNCVDQFLNFDMCQHSDPTMSNETSYRVDTSLPTPSMSPRHKQQLTPPDLDVMTPSTQTSSILPASTTDQTTLYHLSGPSSQIQSIEDDEIMLIKLLTQLKKLSLQTHHTFRSAVSLVDKTNAAIKRMLHSRTVRTDYTCHLLLTSILVHLVTFCELVSTLRDRQVDSELVFDISFSDYDSGMSQEQTSIIASRTTLQLAAKKAVRDTVAICTSVGNFLKRVPLNGFQIVGKNEAALIDLEKRLRHTITLL